MTVVLFVAVLLILVIGHEFGHFIVAKWVKMKVLEFGVGFPPKIWGKQIGETEYTVNWLPFGGFVKIFGEDHKEIGEAAMHARPKLAQAAVMAAGPFANIVLSVILLAAAFMVGVPVAEDAAMAHPDAHVIVAEVLPGSPAEAGGLKAGDRITSAATPAGFADSIANSTGPTVVHITRHGQPLTITLVPTTGIVPQDPDRRAVGVSTTLVAVERLSPSAAIGEAVVETAQHFVLIISSLVTLIIRVFTLTADLSSIAGPVGIAGMTGNAAAFGLGSLLSFAALLSVNLAVINLLPFPALDGGRLFFLGIEAVMRRKIPPAAAHAVNTAGFAILILLMLLVTAHDIGRLVG